MRFIKFNNTYIAEDNIVKFEDIADNRLVIYTKVPMETLFIRFGSTEEKTRKIAEILNQEED